MTRGPAAWAVGVAIGLALVLLPLRKWVTEQQVQGSAAAQYGAQVRSVTHDYISLDSISSDFLWAFVAGTPLAEQGVGNAHLRRDTCA